MSIKLSINHKGEGMNERIRELAEQAGFYVAMFDEPNQDNIKIEKFAKLIIRECAIVASDYDGAQYVGIAIEKHFGIEE